MTCNVAPLFGVAVARARDRDDDDGGGEAILLGLLLVANGFAALCAFLPVEAPCCGATAGETDDDADVDLELRAVMICLPCCCLARIMAVRLAFPGTAPRSRQPWYSGLTTRNLGSASGRGGSRLRSSLIGYESLRRLLGSSWPEPKSSTLLLLLLPARPFVAVATAFELPLVCGGGSIGAGGASSRPLPLSTLLLIGGASSRAFLLSAFDFSSAAGALSRPLPLSTFAFFLGGGEGGGDDDEDVRFLSLSLSLPFSLPFFVFSLPCWLASCFWSLLGWPSLPLSFSLAAPEAATAAVLVFRSLLATSAPGLAFCCVPGGPPCGMRTWSMDVRWMIGTEGISPCAGPRDTAGRGGGGDGEGDDANDGAGATEEEDAEDDEEERTGADGGATLGGGAPDKPGFLRGTPLLLVVGRRGLRFLGTLAVCLRFGAGVGAGAASAGAGSSAV